MEVSRLSGVKALFFDVFGTTVDWRSTVTNFLHLEAQNVISKPGSGESTQAAQKASRMTLSDWGNIAQQWRTSYYESCASFVKNPDGPYKNIDQCHYENFITLLDKENLNDLWPESEIARISLIWHRLDPWPDTVQGIKALNTRVQTCTLSNGNVALLTDMAEYAKLDWTHIFSGEMYGTFKPNPKVYLGSAEKLGLEPSECAMVAAHLNDLKAAKNLGFKAIYVERPQEEAWGDERVAEVKKEGWVDIWVEDGNEGFLTVASMLGAQV